MRELAYMGFSILHPEALEPVIEQRIPVHIRNTNNPAAPGTKIIPERTHIDRAITGIAASDQFVALSLSPCSHQSGDRYSLPHTSLFCR